MIPSTDTLREELNAFGTWLLSQPILPWDKDTVPREVERYLKETGR